MLVVHPHFHRRRTGVTAHVESVLAALDGVVEGRALGSSLSARVSRIGWGELLRRSRREPVVWHAHRNNELLVGLLLRFVGRRVRLVYTRHSAGPPGFLTRLLVRAVHRMVALTSQVAAGLERPAAVIGHGVDTRRFHPPGDREAAFRALGLGGRFGVGVVGRIRSPKGQADFVEALSPLLPSHPEWRAALVGLAKPADRPFLDRLRAAAGGALHLPGEQADIVPWYQGLTVLVQPSREESFSLVLLEAMASGCCVVAARLPHFPELVEHGRTGFLYPPGDTGALRRLLAPLLADPSRAGEVGRSAAEEVRRRFGIESEALALAELYRAAAEA